MCLGLGFAVCARDRLRVDGTFATPAFPLVLTFTGMIVLPVTLYLYLAHTAWSWLYLVDPDHVPALAIVPVLVFHTAAVIGGWYAGARLLRTDRHKIALYIIGGGGALVLLMTALLWGRLGRYGSYEEFMAGRASALMAVKLGYVLVPVILGIGGAATFVAMELVRDSRRVRAR